MGIIGLLLFLFITGWFSSKSGYNLVVIENPDPNSMYPTYFQGDLFIIKKMDAHEYAVGDVIVYEGKTQLVIHRIIEILISSDGERHFRIKGDDPVTNNRPDDGSLTKTNNSWVTADYILGATVQRIPHIGHLSVAVQNNPFMTIIITIVLIVSLISLFMEDDDDEEKSKHIEINSETIRLEIQKQLQELKLKIELILKYKLIVLFLLGLLISPSIIIGFLQTDTSKNGVGIEEVKISYTAKMINNIDSVASESVFIQAEVTIYNQKSFSNILGYDMLVYLDEERTNDISHTIWNIDRKFRGVITVGGSIIFAGGDDLPFNTNTTVILHGTIILHTKTFFVNEDIRFDWAFNYTYN